MRSYFGQATTLVAVFGTGQTGLSTVGYKLWNGDGTQYQARTTTGVSEVVAGTGTYKVELGSGVFSAAFDGYVVWDTGGESPVYATEDVQMVAAPPVGTDYTQARSAKIDNLDATVSSRSTVAAIWAAVTDSSGVTTLLSRIASALTITGGKIDVNDKTGFALTSAYDPAKTAAQAGDAMALTSSERTTLAAAMWAALTSGLSTVGSIGKLLVTNIDATIGSRLPTSAYTAPDNAGIAAIEAKTDLLGSGVVTYGGPVLNASRVEIVQGDDYLEIDGRALSWTSTDWPDLTGATVTLDIVRTVHPHTENSYPADVISATQVDVELTSVQTSDLHAGTWSFALKAILTDLSVATLAQGVMVVLIAPAP